MILDRGSVSWEEARMTEKQLKKLSRAELLELLLAQTKEVENLREKLIKAEALLSDRHIRVLEAGDLAHAVLAVNGVMEAAQAAAQQYLDNMTTMEQETRRKCDQMLEEARREATRIRENALANILDEGWGPQN